MKKSILALAILGAISGAAVAQSSVTVFGILDVGVRSVTNGDITMKQLSNNGYSANQLGFRGVEDLGDGLKAAFWLEAAVSPDLGTASASLNNDKFFSRRATVALITNYGEVRLGRDLNASYLNLGTFDAFGNLGLGSNLNLISTLGSGATTLVRTDNAISYFTPPTLGGFYGQLMAAPGEGNPGTRYRAARIGFSDGKMNVSASIGETGTATNDNFTLANLGASYDFGVVKVMGIYNQTEYGAKKQVVMGLGANAPINDFWQIRASAQRVNASGAGTDANDANLYAVGGIYLLSKRTALYGTASRISNKGAAFYSVNSITSLPLSTAATGRTSSGYEFGIRHGF